MEYKIIIAGFGGQGVLFLGKVLAQAAILDGYEASWLPSYGPEMRGGTANCRLVISDKAISSPAIRRADALIALNMPSLERFSDCADSLIITDARFAQYYTAHENVKVIGVDTGQCCAGGKYDGLANMLALGALTEKAKPVSIASVHRAIELTAKAKTEKDIDAMEFGRISV